MRLKFRFSLRALLFFALTLGAAAAVWRNYDPWRVEREFHFDPASDPKKNLLYALSPNGKWVHGETTTETTDGALRNCSIAWHIESGRTFRVTHDIEIGPNWSQSEFSNDSSIFLSESANENHFSAKLWDVLNEKEIVIPELAILTKKIIPTSNSLSVKRVRMCPDSKHILVRQQDESVQLINLETKKVLITVPNVHCEKFSASGHLFVVHSVDDTIRIHETVSGRELKRIERPIDWEFLWIRHVTDRLFFVEVALTETEMDYNERSVLCYDLKNTREPTVYSGHLEWRTNLSKDESLAVFSGDNEFRVVDIRTQKLISKAPLENQIFAEWFDGTKRIFNMTGGEMYETSSGNLLYKIKYASLALPSPDRRIALISNFYERNCQLHDLANGKLLQVLRDEQMGAWFLQNGLFFRDGTRFITQNRTTRAIHLWHRYRPEPLWGLAWLPEFWFLMAFTIAFVWVLKRDWKAESLQ